MPFESESDSASTLTIIPYLRKPLYVKGMLYLILLYLITDINFGIISAINPEANIGLLLSFQSLADKYNITFTTMRLNPMLTALIFGFFLVIIVSFAIVGMKLADLIGILIHPIKSKLHLYPHLVVLSPNRIEIHSKKNEQERKKEVFAWHKEIFSVKVKVPTQYRLRIILYPSSTLPQEFAPSQKIKHIVRLDRMFMSNRDRKKAAATLTSYFKTHIPDIITNT